jgi:hypothetical protein
MIGGHNNQWQPVPEEFKSWVHCESIVAVAMARGQFGNPERGMSTVGNRYQRTDEGTEDWENLVRAVVNCQVWEIELECEL